MKLLKNLILEMKKIISAQIVTDSMSPQGHRITTFLLTYPRFIHAEIMTHRVFSRNTASSRAIPFEKMVKMIKEDPFIPIAWQKDHKGMQGTEYITDPKIIDFKKGVWLHARNKAIQSAEELRYNLTRIKSMEDIQEIEETSVTKQLCNRLLEPFMWHTALVTATEWENFYELRCPQYHLENVPTVNEDLSLNAKTITLVGKSKKELLKQINEIDNDSYTGFKTILNKYSDLDWLQINKSQAEIHMQALAESMWDAMNESTPKQLQAGEWHIPFGDNIDEDKIEEFLRGPYRASYVRKEKDVQHAKIEISTARCARLSYMTFDGEIDYEKDIKLYDTLLKSHHMSPFEHCARAMTQDEYYLFAKGKADDLEDNIDYCNIMFSNPSKNIIGWCNNFHGFIQYRYLIENGLSI